jgi:hypothetical protein
VLSNISRQRSLVLAQHWNSIKETLTRLRISECT